MLHQRVIHFMMTILHNKKVMKKFMMFWVHLKVISCQKASFLENTHLILETINREHKQVVVSSFQSDPETKDSYQEQSNVKEEASLSPFAHQEAHTGILMFFKILFIFVGGKWPGHYHFL